MARNKDSAGDEVAAIAAVNKALSGLTDQAARDRVIGWARSAHGSASSSDDEKQVRGREAKDGGKQVGDASAPSADLHELMEQADPVTKEDRVLVASFWVQQNESAEGFGSQRVNTLLNDMGHKDSAINKTFAALMQTQPALVRQTHRSGKTIQARKTYRVTDAGKKRVAALIAGKAEALES